MTGCSELQPPESAVTHHLIISLGCHVTIYKSSKKESSQAYIILCNVCRLRVALSDIYIHIQTCTLILA